MPLLKQYSHLRNGDRGEHHCNANSQKRSPLCSLAAGTALFGWDGLLASPSWSAGFLPGHLQLGSYWKNDRSGFVPGSVPLPWKHICLCVSTHVYDIYIYIYIDVHTDKTYTLIPISLFLAGGLSNYIPKWGQLETYSLGLESVNDQWLILRAIPTYCKVVPPSKAHALPVFVPTQRGERRYISIYIYIYIREKKKHNIYIYLFIYRQIFICILKMVNSDSKSLQNSIPTSFLKGTACSDAMNPRPHNRFKAASYFTSDSIWACLGRGIAQTWEVLSKRFTLNSCRL